MRQWLESKNWVHTKNSLTKRRWFVFIWNKATHFFHEEGQGTQGGWTQHKTVANHVVQASTWKMGNLLSNLETEKSWQAWSVQTLSGSVYMNSPGWEKGADFILAVTALQWDTSVQSYTLNPTGISHLLLFSHGSSWLSQSWSFLTFIMALRILFRVWTLKWKVPRYH